MGRFFTKVNKDGKRGIQMRKIPEGKGCTSKLSKVLSMNLDSPGSTRAQQDNPSSSTPKASQLQCGTRNCYTGVGLCLPIFDTDREFVALINAVVRAPKVHTTLKRTVVRACSVEEGYSIQREVRHRLRQRFKKGFWEVDKVNWSKVEIICPWPSAGGQKMTGYYVVAGIRALLNMPGGWSCDRRSHGLLCNPQSGAAQPLSDVDFEPEWFKVQTWERVVGMQRVRLTAINEKAEEMEDWRVEIYRNH